MLATSVLVGLPTAAQAAPTLYTSSDGQYQFYCTAGGHSAIVETYLGSSTDITVPTTVSSTESGSCQVDTLGVSVYQGKGLTSVTFQHKPDVPAGAFTNNSIATVQLASGTGMTTIEAGAFAHQTIGGAAVVGWLDDRDMVVDDIAGSFDGGRFEAVTKDRFTVAFDPKNGSEPVFEQQVFDGDLATEPPVPADPPLEGGDATGVEFLGWFTAGGDRFDFDQPITGGVSLQARWNYVYARSYTVTLQPENGRSATTFSAPDGGRSIHPRHRSPRRRWRTAPTRCSSSAGSRAWTATPPCSTSTPPSPVT